MHEMEAIERAIGARMDLLARLEAEGTDCVRLFHGTVEGAPGLTVDRYGPVLLVQTWREPLAEGDLQAIGATVQRMLGLELALCWNHRGPERRDGVIGSEASDPRLESPVGRELGALYDVRPRHRGQDPLLFLDFRVARRWLRASSAGASVLNLFAYTCGAGVAAALGGAREVWNVDFARSSLEVGRANARRNDIDDARFVEIEENALPVMRQLAGLPVKVRGAPREYRKFKPRTFELVVLDPPRWARTPFGAVDVVRDYPSLFKPAVLCCAPGGRVLATNHVPSADKDEWVAVLRRTVEKAGRSVASIELLTPEDDFPSPDARPPLKIAIVEVGP